MCKVEEEVEEEGKPVLSQSYEEGCNGCSVVLMGVVLTRSGGISWWDKLLRLRQGGNKNKYFHVGFLSPGTNKVSSGIGMGGFGCCLIFWNVKLEFREKRYRNCRPLVGAQKHLFVKDVQSDQIGRFIALWATFQSLWQQLFCPNFPHFRQIFVKL